MTNPHFPPGIWTNRVFKEQDFQVRWTIPDSLGEWLVGAWVHKGGRLRSVIAEDTIFVQYEDLEDWYLVAPAIAV